MKRSVCLVLIMAMLFPIVGLSEVFNYAAMTTEELITEKGLIDNELLKRTAKEDGKIFLLDQSNGLSIYINKTTKQSGWGNYAFVIQNDIIIVNNGITTSPCYYIIKYINGWLSGSWDWWADDLEPGRKEKESFSIHVDMDYIDSSDDPVIIEFELHAGDWPSDKAPLLAKYKMMFSNGKLEVLE